MSRISAQLRNAGDPLPENAFVAGYDGGSFFIEWRWKRYAPLAFKSSVARSKAKTAKQGTT